MPAVLAPNKKTGESMAKLCERCREQRVGINPDEVQHLLRAAVVGSAVEVTFRLRALAEIAQVSTAHLCAIAAALVPRRAL